MKFRDYYEILGVKKDSTADEIHKAYRKQARKCHPDVNKAPGSETRFKELGEAHEVLKDPEKRKRYDEYGSGFQAGQDFRPPPGASKPSQSFEQFEGGENFSDFFESLFGGSSMFNGSGRAGNRRTQFGDRTENSADATKDKQIVGEISLSFDEAYRGGARTVSLEQQQGGSASNKAKNYQLAIPAGIRDGMSIRLEPKSNLYVRLRVELDSRFLVVGNDLNYLLQLNPWEMVLGTKVEIPLPSGAVRVSVPPLAQNGQKLRLRGKGLYRGKNERGDLYLVFQAAMPKSVSTTQMSLWEQLAKEA